MPSFASASSLVERERFISELGSPLRLEVAERGIQ